MVSFLNTLPFRYAFSQCNDLSEVLEISEDIPSVCAEKLLKNEVDIGLIPVAVLPYLSDYYIISDYCIGAKQAVDSVFLFSHQPVEDLKTVYLDFRSRTSVQLVQILSKNHWNVSPEFIHAKPGYESEIKGSVGGVVIGDKALAMFNDFSYRYDLAKAWYDYTGDEFVFAAWVSCRPLPEDFVKKFNDLLTFGIKNLNKAIDIYGKNYPDLPVEHYLKKRIDYWWTDSKKRSLQMFLKQITQER